MVAEREGTPAGGQGDGVDRGIVGSGRSDLPKPSGVDARDHSWRCYPDIP